MNNNEISCLENLPINFCDNNCPRGNLRYCCETLIQNNTCVQMPICMDVPIKTCEYVEAKIVKKCACKILIQGILHKKIRYATCINHNHTIVKKVPFGCYIDVDEILDTDIYEIVGSSVICNYNNLEILKTCNGKKCIMQEMDIVQIIVQRIEN